MTSDFAWNRAIQIPLIDLTAEQREAGWPDAFSLKNLARLQFPFEGNDAEKNRARRDRSALHKAMSAAVGEGTLATVECTRTKIITCSKLVFDRDAPRRNWVSDGRGGEEPPKKRIHLEAGKETEPFRAIDRDAARDYLTKLGLVPSEHVKAWFDTMQPAQKLAHGTKRMTKNGVFLELLVQIEEAWKASGRVPLDRNEWPGQSQDLCDLAGRLFPEAFGNMKPDSFYRNYPKKAGLRFSASKGVREIYAELFPKGGASDGQKFAA